MARISNDLATWEREAQEGDWSSSVFNLALAGGYIERSLLSHLPEQTVLDQIKRQIHGSDILEKLRMEWQKQRDHILDSAETCRSVNVSQYVHGLEQLEQLHCEYKGRI